MSASPPNQDSVHTPHVSADRPIRRGTASTVGSEGDVPPPVPPGIYTLPISGNCPKCHHHHKAATIKVPSSAGTGRATGHVYCDNCEAKWLTFGGRSSTISLISTNTIEPDVVQQDFQYALLDMVRSVTSIASPAALASVPEVSSGVPSREPSTRSQNVAIVHSRSQASHTPVQLPLFQNGSHTSSAPVTNPELNAAPHAEAVVTAASTQQTRGVLRRLKAGLKSRLIVLKKFHPRQLDQVKKRIRMSEIDRESPAMVQVDPPYEAPIASQDIQLQLVIDDPQDDIALPNAAASATVSTPSDRPLLPASDGEREILKAMTREQRVARFQGLFSDETKDRLRGMSKEDRIAWIRARITEFKRGNRIQQQRRHTLPSTNHSHTDGDDLVNEAFPPPQPSPQSPPQRPEHRYSADLPYMGGHLDAWRPGELFYESHPFSIGSSTRLSEAATAVTSDRVTVTSGVPSLEVGPQYPPRGQSRSPRPHSLGAGRSLLRHSVGPDEIISRPSLDSVTSIAAVRGFAGVGVQTDGHSITSVRSFFRRNDTAPSVSSQTSLGLFLSGHQTFEERRMGQHRRSSSITPTP
jgi:hypothetical protein